MGGPFYFASQLKCGHSVIMTLETELFWSFRSPYSYLATQRYADIADRYDLHIKLRPVYPLAIRKPNFFEQNHPNWLGYTMRDMMRVAQFHNIEFSIPSPDPIVQNMTTREIASEQPYIFRLTRLGQIAARRGQSLNFCNNVSKLIWGGVKDWDKGDHLRNAAADVGLDFDAMHSEATDDAEKLDAEIAENQVSLEASGHWGVPTLVIKNEPFFGQDRIEMALWRMKQLGLKPKER